MSATADSINDAADELSDRADDNLHRRASQLQKFFDDVEDLLRRVSTLDDREISRLRSRVESSIEQVRTAASDRVNAAIEGTRSAATATDDYVHQKPWLAIGATAIACLALGALLRGK